ncbi:hypothetical protein [Sorangium sp. So ce887]|uniref:hypothetical protein n=1 Tax=Sorangium sp. So ce887 TaxID=3133324 RepID=UPI003F5FD768
MTSPHEPRRPGELAAERLSALLALLSPQDGRASPPRTFLAQLERWSTQTIAALENVQLDPSLVRRLLQTFLRLLVEVAPRLQDGAASATPTDPQISSHASYVPMRKLAEAAYSRNPKATYRTIRSTDQEELEQGYFLMSSALGHAAAALELETQADFAMTSIRRGYEKMYRRYVKTIFDLYTLASDKAHRPSIDTGEQMSLLDNIQKKYPNIIDKRAIFVRNAAAHDNWDVDPEDPHAFVLWNEHKTQERSRRTPRQRFTLNDLMSLAHDMGFVCTRVFPAVTRPCTLHYEERFIQRVSPVLPEIVNDDPNTSSAAVELVNEELDAAGIAKDSSNRDALVQPAARSAPSRAPRGRARRR